MRTKWLLIALPLAILVVLLQSALWVPTYASQAQGNPGRLRTFVRASPGEVKYLNPAVSSDFTAGQLMHENLFEGLVTVDENLKLSPKLAERWDVTEVAYVAVLPERRFQDGHPASAALLRSRIEAAWKQGQLGGLESSIVSVSTTPSAQRASTATVLVKNAKGKDEPLDVELTIDLPERVCVQLSKVEPELFARLGGVLGAAYFEPVTGTERFRLKKPELLAAVRPKLPELFQVGEHHPIVTFHLRSGVRWHDGVPFTAEDVKFNYEALTNPKNSSPRAGAFESIESVEVVDELTAKVTYKRLYSPAIVDWTQTLIPKHALDDAALEREGKQRHEKAPLNLRSTAFNRRPIGTGPFKFAEWRPNQFIHLVRNEQYWGRRAEYEHYYFRNVPDYLTMELEFAAGALDMYDARPHQAERYRRDPDYQLVSGNDGAYAFIGYNLRRPLFQDVRVRRALGMAIDVASIIKYVLAGEGKRATGPYYSNTPYYDPELAPLPYDPKGALELLAQAGWTKNARGILEKNGQPLRFTLVTNAGNPQRKAIMTIAQEAWAKLGVDITIQDFEWTVFLEDFIQTQNFDAMVLAWAGGATNPDMHTLWHSSQTHPYEQNVVGYESAEADELIAKIRTTYDPNKTIRLTQQLHRLIARDQPYTFLYEPLMPYVFDKRIGIIDQDAQGHEVAKKLATPPSGDVFQFFRRWRKLASAPEAVR